VSAAVQSLHTRAPAMRALRLWMSEEPAGVHLYKHRNTRRCARPLIPRLQAAKPSYGERCRPTRVDRRASWQVCTMDTCPGRDRQPGPPKKESNHAKRRVLKLRRWRDAPA